MQEQLPHQHCAALIKEQALREGIDVEVTVRMPTGFSPFQRSACCVHGITYWVHPSDGQIEEWKRIGMNP